MNPYIEALRPKLSKQDYEKLCAISIPKVHEFIAKSADLCNAEHVFICSDSEEDKNYIYQGKNNITNYEIKNGNLEITAINPIGDVWQIAKNHVLFNVYFELIVTTGDTCVGKDGYGVLLRAPDQADGVIDSGYVFGFTCDGMYRIYRMDNGEYNSIQEWTASDFIRPGPIQTNRLGINADGNKFQLYANGEFLTEFVDANFPSGLFGTMIRSETTNNFKINIEEIAYWRIPN